MAGGYKGQDPPKGVRVTGILLLEMAIGVVRIPFAAELVLEPHFEVVRAGHVRNRRAVIPRMRVVIILAAGRFVIEAHVIVVMIDDAVPAVGVQLLESGH